VKLNQSQGNKLVEIIAMFLINIVVFLLSKIFVSISFGLCFLYSLINTSWMPFVLLPALKKIQQRIEKKERAYSLEPLQNYIRDFEKRQKEVEKEIQLDKQSIDEIQKKFRFDWKLFNKHLQRKGIKHLYHFTDEANLNSIIENEGLFSWSSCNSQNIKIPKPGGSNLSRQLDERAGLENFVRLSFTPDHPMMYAAISDGRIQNPVVLEIDYEVVFLKESKFSDKNAARTQVNVGQTFEDFAKIRFDILTSNDYLNSSETDRPYFQAEVLVKEKIPIGYIKNIQKIKTTCA